MQKSIFLIFVFAAWQTNAHGQSTPDRPQGPTPMMNLDAVLSTIAGSHPSVKMYDADIRASDEAAKGARSWDAPSSAPVYG